MRQALVAVMAARWPRHGNRRSLLRQWSGVGDLQMVLADIALRGGVFAAPVRTPGDLFGDGINEGRRQLALEIIETAGMPHDKLFALLEKAAPSTEEKS